MGRTFDAITDHHREWLARQHMFFVATAPAGADGHVNLSPKGPIGSLRVRGPHRVAYVDVGGSGAETIAHVRENGRIVIMVCAFQGPPRILRFHGCATVLQRYEAGFDELLAEGGFDDPSLPEARRAIIDVMVTRVSDSCGYTVPRWGSRAFATTTSCPRPSASGRAGKTATGAIGSKRTRPASTACRPWRASANGPDRSPVRVPPRSLWPRVR